jgi:hypothetical protein
MSSLLPPSLGSCRSPAEAVGKVLESGALLAGAPLSTSMTAAHCPSASSLIDSTEIRRLFPTSST